MFAFSEKSCYIFEIFGKASLMTEKTKLLVVEDEDSLRTLIKSELEDEGYVVTGAENGERALEELSKEDFGIVILDIRMPGMDGMEVLKIIRQKNLADKVIMLTAVDELKIARESLQLGANDFLTKPYSFKNLLTCIDRVMKE